MAKHKGTDIIKVSRVINYYFVLVDNVIYLHVYLSKCLEDNTFRGLSFPIYSYFRMGTYIKT